MIECIFPSCPMRRSELYAIVGFTLSVTFIAAVTVLAGG